MSKRYIHHGSDEFEPSRVKPIKNLKYFSKPEGGLWGSPADSKYGWENWCLVEDFRLDKLKKSFEFVLESGSNLLEINSVIDLLKLPKVKEHLNLPHSHIYLDFEKLAEDGVDAIEVNIVMIMNYIESYMAGSVIPSS